MKKMFVYDKVKLFMFSLLIASITVACSSDDDDNVDGGGGSLTAELETPEYADVSALYMMQSNVGGIESIELTESGSYIIKMNGSTPGYSKERTTRFTLDPMVTRVGGSSNTGIIAGSFIQISDTEYILEGYGSIVIAGSTGNAFSIEVTKQDEEPIVVSCEKMEQKSNTDLTKSLCRSWSTEKLNLQFKFNGRVIFDKTRPATEYPALIDDLNRKLMDYFDMDEPMVEEDNFYSTEVIFTRAGSYLVKGYVEGYGEAVALSYWTWTDEASGLMRWSYSYNLDSTNGSATISFDDNQLIITETPMKESEDGMTLEATLKTYCTEII